MSRRDVGAVIAALYHRRKDLQSYPLDTARAVWQDAAMTKRNDGVSARQFHAELRKRRASGATQAEIAALLGCTPPNIHLWEMDRNITPRIKFRRRMREALNAERGAK